LTFIGPKQVQSSNGSFKYKESKPWYPTIQTKHDTYKLW